VQVLLWHSEQVTHAHKLCDTMRDDTELLLTKQIASGYQLPILPICAKAKHRTLQAAPGLSSAHFVLCAGADPARLAYHGHTVQEDAGFAPLS
jgi:hypothetical protein